MSTTAEVESDEAGIRLDRWFKRHYPALTHGHLEKLLRTGQVRVDGKRAKSGDRLEAGQAIRLPPQIYSIKALPQTGAQKPSSGSDRSFIENLVIHEDANFSWTGWYSTIPQGQVASVGLSLTALNLVCSKPSTGSIISGLAA